MQTTNENISPSVINRLVKELKESQKSPLEGIDVVINEENITDVQADVEGPGIPVIPVQSLLATRLDYLRRTQPCAQPRGPSYSAMRRFFEELFAAGTPYEGGVFRMKLVLGADFPSAPPKGVSFPTRPAAFRADVAVTQDSS